MNSPAPGAGPETDPRSFDLRAYLRGRWAVDRDLQDRAAGTRGSFRGVITFTDHDGGLRFREDGTLAWTSPAGVAFTGPASREYLLRTASAPDVLDWYFPDGRPFHRMGFTGTRRQDEHWCDPDTYRVSYRLIDADEFRYRWDVTGPAKDHLLTSVLRRLHPGQEPGAGPGPLVLP